MPRSAARSASPRPEVAPRPIAPRLRGRPRPRRSLARMGLADVAEVAALEARIFPDPWSADSFLAEVERRADVGWPVVAREGGELVGYAVIWFIVDELHVGNIAVRPDRQGRGLGRWLLGRILAEGRRRSMAVATLEVRPSNAPARALYASFGFRRIAVRKRYYRDNREDAWVLACALDPAAEDRVA